MHLHKVISIIFIIGLFILNSCAPTTSAAYLSKKNANINTDLPDQEFTREFDYPDTIHINDELYISVTTSSDEPNSFNQTVGGAGGTIELLTYLVDEEGFIKLPYIQRLKVAGLTINQAIDTLENELSQYLYIPSVSIRIINHRFSVLGEVNAPGLYTFNQKALNIYQAIATANDITEYGNRKKVLIVRHKGNIIEKKYINLLSDDIINSEWYIIHPNDLIFVEPLGRKALGMETVPYDLFFSVFSSSIVALTFLLTLTNL